MNPTKSITQEHSNKLSKLIEDTHQLQNRKNLLEQAAEKLGANYDDAQFTLLSVLYDLYAYG